MNAAVGFAAPGPVAISVRSTLHHDEVIDRLARAVGERRYSTPGLDSPGFFRLGGTVAADHLILTARPYVIPGVIGGFGALTIELRGKVVQAENGSEIRGTVSAPIRSTTLAIAAAGLIAWASVGIAGNGSTWPVWIFIALSTAIIVAAWVWALRHNQRMALRNVNELTRMLESIVADSARGPDDPAER